MVNISNTLTLLVGIILVQLMAPLHQFVLCQDPTRRTVDESFNYVSKECDNKLKQINSIAKFQEFLYHYKFLIDTYKKPKRSLLNGNKHIRHCYDEEESIMELEKLVNERHEGICQPDYVDRLVEYHFKYISHDSESDGDPGNTNQDGDAAEPEATYPKSTYIKYFFSYYAHQVGYTCKSRIGEKLRQAQSGQDCSVVLAKAIPQVFAPKQAASGSDAPSGDQQQTLKDISGFLDSFDKVENFAPVMKFKSIKTPQGFYDLIVPDEAIERIDELKNECKLREPFYNALFSPVASLAQLGYTIEESSDLTEKMTESDKKLLKCWLATGQLCQGILRSFLSVNKEKELDSELKSKLVTIRWSPPENSSANGADLPRVALSKQQLDLTESLDEISSYVINKVKDKRTIKSRIKAKALNYAKKFVENRIDIDAMQLEAEKNFIDALTDDDNAIDSKVAFAGKKFDTRQFNPVSVVTKHADLAVKASSSFWGKHIGLVFSSIVGIVLSGVFVWFSLYALATVIKQHHFAAADTGNFKDDYNRLRQKKIDAINEKSKSMFKFYKPT